MINIDNTLSNYEKSNAGGEFENKEYISKKIIGYLNLGVNKETGLYGGGLILKKPNTIEKFYWESQLDIQSYSAEENLFKICDGAIKHMKSKSMRHLDKGKRAGLLIQSYDPSNDHQTLNKEILEEVQNYIELALPGVDVCLV